MINLIITAIAVCFSSL